MKSFPIALTSPTLFPGRLCVITRRDGVVIRIAEADEAVVLSGNTYSPIAGLQISAVKHTLGGELPSMQITFMHASGGTFDTGALDTGRFDSAKVELYIVDRANLVARGLMFTGTIGPITFAEDGTGVFDIRGHASRATGAFVQTYSPMCRTDLFSVLCGLDKDDFAQTGTIGSKIDKFNFTVAGLASPPADGYFNQGVAVTAGGIAFEIGRWVNSTLQITAYLPCSRLITEGEGLTLYPGCDKTIATCAAKFSNSLNFQGEPHSLGARAASIGG